MSKFDLIEMGHKDSGTIAEVILDRVMTNILWLKNPKTSLSIKSLIASYSRDLLVKKRVWVRFYEILRKLRKEEKIRDEDVTSLFYQSYIGDVLKDIDEPEADEVINESFILAEIEKSSKLIEEEKRREIQKIEKNFLEKLEKETKKKEEEYAKK